MNVSTAERGRITARVPAYAQETIEQAAQLTATTTNQFVAQAALKEAERVIKESQSVALSARDMERFLSALESPPPINNRFAAALLRNLKNMENSGAPGAKNNAHRIGWKPRPQSV